MTGIEESSTHAGQQKVNVRLIRGLIRCNRRYAYYCSVKAASPSDSVTPSLKDANSPLANSKIESGIPAPVHSESSHDHCMVVCKINKILNENGEPVPHLRRGDRGTLHLSLLTVATEGEKSKERSRVSEFPAAVGAVLFKGPPLPLFRRRFQAIVTAMTKLPTPIIPGSCFELYLEGREMECHILKIFKPLISEKGIYRFY